MAEETQPIKPGDNQAEAILMRMLFAPLTQQCITVATKLKIADLVAEHPQTVAVLAAKTSSNEDALYRVLRMLSSIGIFKQEKDKFGLTPTASLLRSEIPNSMYSFALMMGEDWIWRNWGELMYSVQTGKIAHDKVHGMSSFEYFTSNTKAGTVFNNAMTNLSKGIVAPIVEAYDFSGVSKVADIGGGHGMLLAGVLKANPQASGILFDLSPVIQGASFLLEKEGVSGRVQLESGDFFESIPTQADIYLMKHIIHGCDDVGSIKILKNIRSAMKDNSKALIIEAVVPEDNEPSLSKMMDILMMIMEGGKERTGKEYRNLLEAADLKLSRIIPTKSPFSLVEAEPM
jgi:O-methyltransferase